MEKIKVLDCTLRDGGYYNSWDFSEEVLMDYLQAVCAARIDMVELGLRNFNSNEFKGAHAFTTEKFLSTLDLPSGPSYGVMVDAKTIIKGPYDLTQGTRKLFTEKSSSKLSFVRVAAHYHELEDAIVICQILKNLGYFVGLNLMQSVGKTNDQIRHAADTAQTANCIDVLYFADSLGNMDESEADRIINCLKGGWLGELGLHAHDNTSRALSNTLHSLNQGIHFLDSTITGMGRGAGNTKTEILLFELNQRKLGNYNPFALHELVLRHFEPMQREYGWGTNLLYHIGAIKNVHPTYIQQLYSDHRFGPCERAAAISYLGSIPAASFDDQNLEKALKLQKIYPAKLAFAGDDISYIFENREILLLGAGETTSRYRKAIAQYISSKNPIVISININPHISNEMVDYYAISHNTKYLSDKEKYKPLERKIIAPASLFPNGQLEFCFNFELVTGKPWKVQNNFCEIPYDNTAAYALSICLAGRATRVSIVGFDGYPHLDVRNKEVQEILDYFKTRLEITCLTPTNYNVATGTIYAL
ncbi:aldolase catalytic domain-containing protein [Pseudomonas citronellolis]|uniref:aldolase catalytic domain-containing protein n=1 Tax=Pseudomonas citronellolis TaxID=53408 RepID=UPI0009E7F77E|nr:aldolase catalytic domain-containing protein [Pseudomonas citronellolis]